MIVTERMNICVTNGYYGNKNISLLLEEIFIANTTMLQRTTSEKYYGELAVDRPVKRHWQLYVIWKRKYKMKY